MAPPKEEWQLWAYRFETDLKKLTQRTDASAQTTAQNSLQTEQLKDLVVSIEHLQEEHDTLNDRVRLLEEEANQQDQLNARKSQEQQKLESKNATLKREFDHVLSAVEGMERLSRADREQSKVEMQTMRGQIQTLLAGRGMDMSLSLVGTPLGSRAPSQASTVDDSMQIEEETPNQPTAAVRHVRKMDMQGNSTLKEYVTYGESIMQLYESQAVKDFVNGMNDYARRKAVWDKLENVGWTWANAKPEINNMIDGMNMKRRSKRRALPALPGDTLKRI